jgi:hypothetical protein
MSPWGTAGFREVRILSPRPLIVVEIMEMFPDIFGLKPVSRKRRRLFCIWAYRDLAG